MDFTRHKYRQLLEALAAAGYEFITYKEYCQGLRPQRFVILRHDVDLMPHNSLLIAHEEAAVNARATYYFRAMRGSWNEHIMHHISSHGHEVGYHYESLTTCHGNVDDAYIDFCKHLKAMREIVPVETVCMHGSPRSPHDSKDLWKRYDFRDLGLLGEPYITTDFSKLLYLSDTGRRWDGFKVSVRDKIMDWQPHWNRKGWVFHTTDDIIRGLRENRLPDQLMITTHPQRWAELGFAWLSEWALQNTKNVIKGYRIRKHFHKV